MLKFGMIGVGKICQGCHLPAYEKLQQSGDVKVVALCDINEDRLKEVGKRFPDAKLYTSYREMIEKEALDAVDICTPNNIHSEAAVFALEHGVHVMCEKPDAVSVAEAEKMKAAAEASGKTLMVMRNNRYRPSTKFLKQYIAEGKMGEIYAGRCGWIRRRGIPGWGGWFTDKAQAGGGPLIDLGVHIIDLSMYLMGNAKPVTVSGCTYLKFPHTSYSKMDVEDLAMGFIRFDNGACLQIEFSWASNIPGVPFSSIRALTVAFLPHEQMVLISAIESATSKRRIEPGKSLVRKSVLKPKHITGTFNSSTTRLN